MTNISNTAHFCSWGWTTFDYVADKANGWELWDIRSRVMIASKEDIWAILKAETQWIDVEVLNDTKNADEIIRLLEKYAINNVFLNGYLPVYHKEAIDYIKSKWGNSFNQHPWPIRANWLDFGWNEAWMWMFGSRVTAARVLYLLSTTGKKDTGQFTESTVQFVWKNVDAGAVVWIEKLELGTTLDGFRWAWKDKVWDTHPLDIDFSNVEHPWTIWLTSLVENQIQPMLLPLEHENVARVMRVLWTWKIPSIVPEYTDSIIPISEEHISLLGQAKRKAVELFPKW